jgi:hypothetical protein
MGTTLGACGTGYRMEAFGGLQRVHKELMEELLRDPTQVNNMNNIAKTEHTKAKEDNGHQLSRQAQIREAQRSAGQQLFAQNQPIS